MKLQENSDFNKYIVPWIGLTSKLLHNYLDAIFTDNKIPITKEQWIILKVLNEDNNGIVQNNLAFLTNRNKTTLTRLLHTMEERKLIERIPAKEDKRKNYVFISKKGKKIFLKTKPTIIKHLKKIQKTITEQEFEVFVKIIKKIQHQLMQKTN